MEGSPVSDSGVFLSNLGCRSGLSGLIIATVTIDNVTADVVIDTGASASFLPREGTVLSESRATLSETRTDARIADNGQLDCSHSSRGIVRVWAGQVRECEPRFLIINKSSHILGYDALFGTDIIKTMGISVCTEYGILVAKIKGHVIGQEDTVDKYHRHLALVSRLKDSPSPATPLECLLNRYSNVFSETAEEVMKSPSMKIELLSTEMPKSRLRRYAVEDVAEMDRQVKSMLDRKIIEPSISSFSSTCHLVPKKNGQRRLVINYVPLNKIAVKDHYPLPQIYDLLAHLSDAKFFCALDCTEGFWQIPVSCKDRHKTAFVTPQGLFQFKRCPFGFTNSPAVFQRAMNEIFKDGLYKRCVIYIDDILVFGRTEEEALVNLEWVLRKCDEHKVKLKMSKCEFLKKTVKFLGYQVGQGDIRPQTDKCEPWTKNRPNTVKEAQAFLGYINYYARFIENFSEKTSIIRRAVRLQPFEWTTECEDVKQELLGELKMATAQRIPPAETPKQIDIAVLDNSIEAACLDEHGQLIMRTSAVLSSTQKNYSGLEKELLALTRAYNKFGPFLRGPVTVKTSCTMLPSALKLKDKPERIARLLLQLPPDAEFKVEARNDVNDVLMQMPEPPDEIFYTDGACRANQDKRNLASWAVIAVNRPELNCSGILEDSTNQKAEIEAVIRACRIASTHSLKKILVVTDSKYVTNAVNKWIDRWQDNGWLDNRNKPVKNEDAFRRLTEAKANIELRVAHTRGHNGDKYNELADKMAREALIPHVVSCAAVHAPPELHQEDDEDILAIKRQLEKGKLVKEYHLKDGVVWTKQFGVDKLLVPKKQRLLLLQLAHYDPIYGAHYGVKKTRTKLNNYHWPGIGTDVAMFVSACVKCQMNKDTKSKTYGKLMPIRTTSLFNRIQMDLIGPLTESTTGQKFIVTAIDAFSRMGFARACRLATAEEVIKLLYDEIISKHGPPEHIITDNGTQFTSNAFQRLVKDLEITHSTTCEYNPKANGMDERFNGTLFKIIKNCISDNKKEWDALLAGAVLAYNLTPNDSTKLSPYTIVYGRLARGPLNPIQLEDDPSETDHDEIRQQASNNMSDSQERIAFQYNKDKQDFTFKPMDLVMVKTLSIGRTESRKFASKWTGPHCVLRLLSHDGVDRAVEILDSDRFKVRRVSFNTIKPYHPPKLRDINMPGETINIYLKKSIQVPADSGRQGSSSTQIEGSRAKRFPALVQSSDHRELTSQNHDQGVGQPPSLVGLQRGSLPLMARDREVNPNTSSTCVRYTPEGDNVDSPDTGNPCSVGANSAEPRGSDREETTCTDDHFVTLEEPSDRQTTNSLIVTQTILTAEPNQPKNTNNLPSSIPPLDSLVYSENSNSSIEPPTPSTLSCLSPSQNVSEENSKPSKSVSSS